MAGFPEKPIYRELARIGKVFGSPVRLRLLDVLGERERTVEELAEEARVPLKNTSAQLQHLRAAARRRDRGLLRRAVLRGVPPGRHTPARSRHHRLARLRPPGGDRLPPSLHTPGRRRRKIFLEISRGCRE
ncbi:ArsR/SmtB family transcription factor [Microtetraspora niveoalba]|uniref:ArsR/SmtB family transcription factor n=1 Tax=Microtetraspora niveoalba TaxID=46175 RepID=UPI0009FD04ED|nr:helix-turn-helix domain-containing protein [Microtetraspora niveoalba]